MTQKLLRIGFAKIPFMVEFDEISKKFSGYVGDAIQSFYILPDFNITYKVLKNIDAGDQLDNGSYTNNLHLFETNQIDFMPMGVSMHLCSFEIVHCNIPVAAVKSRILTVVHPSMRIRDILHYVRAFTPSVWISYFMLLLLVNFIQKAVIAKCTHSKQIQLLKNFITITKLVPIFFILNIFRNSINSDLITLECNDFVDSVKQLASNVHKVPVLWEKDGVADKLRTVNNVHFREIYRRSLLNPSESYLPLDPMNYKLRSKEFIDKSAFICNDFILQGLSNIICDLNSKTKIWISREVVDEMLLSMLTNQLSDVYVKKAIQHSNYIVLENGFGTRSLIRSANNLPLLNNFGAHCVKDKYSEIFEDMEYKLTLKLENVKYESFLFTIPLLMSAFIFAIRSNHVNYYFSHFKQLLIIFIVNTVRV